MSDVYHNQCCSMPDYKFLRWVRDRLVFVYHESEYVDFVLRIGQIADELERIVSYDTSNPKPIRR